MKLCEHGEPWWHCQDGVICYLCNGIGYWHCREGVVDCTVCNGTGRQPDEVTFERMERGIDVL